jgi:hypothetical protein
MPRPLRRLIDILGRLRPKPGPDDNIIPDVLIPKRLGLLGRLLGLLKGGGGLIGTILLGLSGALLGGLRAFLIRSPAFWLIVATVLGLLALVIFGG